MAAVTTCHEAPQMDAMCRSPWHQQHVHIHTHIYNNTDIISLHIICLYPSIPLVAHNLKCSRYQQDYIGFNDHILLPVSAPDISLASPIFPCYHHWGCDIQSRSVRYQDALAGVILLTTCLFASV